MKRVIPTLVVLCLVLHLQAQVERDKALHFVGGSLFGLVGAGVAKKASDGNRVWTFAGAVVGSTLIGVAKEAVDAGQRENGWDNDDLIATILGGVTVGIAIELFSKKRNKRLRYSKSRETTFYNMHYYPMNLDAEIERDKASQLPRLTPPGFSDTVLEHFSVAPKSFP